MQLEESAPSKKASTAQKDNTLCIFKHCKKHTTHQYDECYQLEQNKDKRSQWYNDILEKRAKAKAEKSKKTN